MAATSKAARAAASGRKAGARLVLCAVVGLAVGGAVALADQLRLAPVAGWMAMATAYAVEVWLSIKGFDAEETDAHATREDPSRPAADLLLVLAAVVSLAAVALVLGGASQATGGTKVAYVALSLGSVVASWFVVHTLYTLHYARLYYGDEVGGIGFNQDNAPSYSDFAYVAFTLGMTFQVSDTDLQTSPIRSAALRHALLSYLFGAGILATTINLVAGLSK